jgi:hypothetical protein
LQTVPETQPIAAFNRQDATSVLVTELAAGMILVPSLILFKPRYLSGDNDVPIDFYLADLHAQLVSLIEANSNRNVLSDQDMGGMFYTL